MTPKTAVASLKSAGFTQARIADIMRAEYGLATTQQTISRIENGDISDPGWKVGSALIALAVKAGGHR